MFGLLPGHFLTHSLFQIEVSVDEVLETKAPSVAFSKLFRSYRIGYQPDWLTLEKAQFSPTARPNLQHWGQKGHRCAMQRNICA